MLIKGIIHNIFLEKQYIFYEGRGVQNCFWCELACYYLLTLKYSFYPYLQVFFN